LWVFLFGFEVVEEVIHEGGFFLDLGQLWIEEVLLLGFEGEVGSGPLEGPEAAFGDVVSPALEDLDFAVGALDGDVDGAVGGGG